MRIQPTSSYTAIHCTGAFRPAPPAWGPALSRAYSSFSDSKRWLDRQRNDPYVKKAQQLNLRSRGAFKLIEIDQKYHFLRSGAVCIDCGAAPGGWSEDPAAPSAAITGTAGGGDSEKYRIFAMDLLPMAGIDGVQFFQRDFTQPESIALLKNALKGKPVNTIVSDMAPSFSGTHSIDHLRTMNLCEDVLGLAGQVLAPGGTMVCKFLVGGSEQEFRQELRNHFNKVNIYKPKASRKESSESYFVCLGKKRSP
ncbi:ftsJ-like methyltransferase family protein [Dimargaris cristalligena]|uniref:rRNA methyltransferase 2, mitochondrial n=1 Tax=Dimargaris cristalligena TaxID=215637 RepID=A0A4Q0A3M4_9FUNG|nr:ftsJ-like methyltransferase family protein [Dimargaris cristalligena]|eukprot:RKP39860.1 ftsJ-like methyltransferase family protein [Dimargaris cristalligena]